MALRYDAVMEMHDVKPTYRKDDGTWLLELDGVKLPTGFNAMEKDVVMIAPGATAGNHVHDRSEAFIALGDGLEIDWHDDNGDVDIVEFATMLRQDSKVTPVNVF